MAETENDIIRYNPDFKQGLTKEQLEERITHKLVNKTERTVGKTYLQIVLDNVVNFFNILLFVIAGLMIAAKRYDSLFFLAILIPNIIIGLIEDIHARRLMDKLSLVTSPKVIVIRDGVEEEISSQSIVLDDLVVLKSGMQICADSIVLSGNLLVNESLLTGESKSIPKKPGDVVFSGSYVLSGNAITRADKIGQDSYVQTIEATARKFKRSPSQILKSLRLLFKYIGIAVIVIGATMVIILGIQGMFSSYEGFQKAMGSISGSMVAMIPTGLYLLTSVALATAVIKLSQHKARVQDFYSVEMLARTDLVCVDKTGTITDGTMTVNKIVPYGSTMEATVTGILSDFVIASEDNNATMMSLKEHFDGAINKVQATEKLSFNSDNKYSAITFQSGITYVLGAAEFMNLNNKSGVLHRIEEYTSKGFRVLILAKAPGGIKNEKVEGLYEAIGMVVLQDHVRPDAIKTFKWFRENNVAIKVISGDDAQTVAQIAKQAGIEGADKYISLAGKTIEEVKSIANDYDVFGRVTPEQKEALVDALKKDGHTVAMTGDGVNDILALKHADCSIAMASGAEAAKNISHIVLLDSNFDHLPMVVEQGRRVVNNLQRTASLFLVKTSFAIILSVIFMIGGLINKNTSYPFETNHLYIWEFASIGVASLFLTLEPNVDRLKGTFLRNVFSKALPAAITMILGVVVIFGLYHLNKNNVMYTGIYSKESAVVMSSIVFTGIAWSFLLKVCRPFTIYRAVVFGVCSLITFGGLIAAALISLYAAPEINIFHYAFNEMNAVNYFVTGIVLISLVTLYLAITYIVEVLKGERKNANN